jgi:hypothetical protein
MLVSNRLAILLFLKKKRLANSFVVNRHESDSVSEAERMIRFVQVDVLLFKY